MQTEYIKSLNCNYARILLNGKPEEKRYQYCIVGRGGIKGLLPCNLRYINGQGYLYYDITSKQNVQQIYTKKYITRDWIKDFLWSFRQVRQELERFLLDAGNILLFPEQIFQDLESRVFAFLYVPYYEGKNGIKELMDFWVEHIDYDDDLLVTCVYHMYEQMDQNGDVYIQKQIFEDAKMLEAAQRTEVDTTTTQTAEAREGTWRTTQTTELREGTARTTQTAEVRESTSRTAQTAEAREGTLRTTQTTEVREGAAQSTQTNKVAAQTAEKKASMQTMEVGEIPDSGLAPEERTGTNPSKRRFFGIFDGKKKDREIRNQYRQNMQEIMSGYAVAEDTSYDEDDDYGRTIYIEEPADERETKRRIETSKGQLVAVIKDPVLTMGKKKGEADIVLEDASVSRLHARITKEKDTYFIEDLNSTNGTFKNGLQLQPYERRELEEGDEIKLGRVVLIFR